MINAEQKKGSCGDQKELSRSQLYFRVRERLIRGFMQGLISATAAIVAYIPTQALGLREGFWAAITAVAVVQRDAASARNSARDQFAGAAIGGGVGAVIVTLAGQHVISYALAVIVAMTLCWLLNIVTAGRLAGITATIILLVPHQGSAESMMLSRITEVGWGVTVAIAIVWLAHWIENRVGKTRKSDTEPA